MSPKSSKEELDSIMKKRFEKRKEEMVEKEKAEVKEELKTICYTVCEHPENDTKFVIAKIIFDLKTMKSLVEDYVDLEQKVIGKRYPMDQDQIKYYYDRKKKENK